MKRTITLLLILSSLLSYSQKKEFHIKTKDGREYFTNTYIPQRSHILVKNNDQSIQIGYGNIERIDVNYLKEKNKKYNHSAVFINFSEKYGSLMKILVEGKCNLYSNTELAFGGGTGTGFFVLRENEIIATQLCDKNYLTILNFKKRASEYFEDCDILVEKIQQKKYKRKQVIEAVKFYNENCK